MTTKVQRLQISIDEYRRREEMAQTRHEYRDGEVVPMTGGTYEHNGIALNWVTYLNLGRQDQSYQVRAGDMRLWIPQYQQAVYPDVLVIVGEPRFNGDRRDEILNPCLIVEVLSPSTEARDRGDKFRYYQSIPEFREYLLVHQNEPRVEQFLRRDEKEWSLRLYDRRDTTISLGEISLDISLQEIYQGILEL